MTSKMPLRLQLIYFFINQKNNCSIKSSKRFKK